jgi:hypothetical protein
VALERKSTRGSAYREERRLMEEGDRWDRGEEAEDIRSALSEDARGIAAKTILFIEGCQKTI